MSAHCCQSMDADLDRKCEIHSARADCPDALIARVRGGYGLYMHDGGSSVVEISFCPWRGWKLPKMDIQAARKPQLES